MTADTLWIIAVMFVAAITVQYFLVIKPAKKILTDHIKNKRESK